MTGATMPGVALLAARRTAVVPRGGMFRDMEPFALAAALIGPLLADAGIAPDAVDEVILGNALSGGGNVARVAALAAGLPEHVPALTLDTQCCSGLDAIRVGVARIASGEARYVLAGGVESFSRAPLRAHRPRAKVDAPLFYRQPAFTPWPAREPDLAVAAAELARTEGLTRRAQEAFAAESHRRALAAMPPVGEIVPVNAVAADPFARALSPALLARLPVIAGDAAYGVTAATTAVEADAAALVLLGPGGEGRVHILGALARGGDPLMPALAPVAAVEVLCARLGLHARDIEYVELMEAYAAQAMVGITRLGLDPARVNAQGGALARGHPIGASGAVLAVRAFHRLQAAGGRALVAIAGAGGIASAMVLSRKDETLQPWQDRKMRSGEDFGAGMDARPQTVAPAVPPAPVSAAGQALVLALVDVLDTLNEAIEEPDPVEMVHDARKAMKELRALLRLVPGETALALRRHTAEVARTLSGARDKAAAGEAVDVIEAAGLLLACDATDARAAIGPDAAAPEEAERHRSTVTAFGAQVRARLAGDFGPEVAAADVGAGLAKAYRQARRAHFADPRAMHEVRKRVVTHRYQMGFIASAFGGRGTKRARKAQRLRDILGAYQDIEILRPLLQAAPDLADGTRQRLDFAMDLAQKRLKKKARVRHKALFRLRPGAFLDRYRDLI